MAETHQEILRVSPEIFRAVRAYLNISYEKFSHILDIPVTDLQKIETGELVCSPEQNYLVRSALRSMGLQILPNGGFSVRDVSVETLEGYIGVRQFFEDVYLTTKIKNTPILISGVENRQVLFIRQKVGIGGGQETDGEMDLYRQKMALLKATCKMLVNRDTKDLSPAPYVEHRRVPSEVFHSNVPFYIYGDKVAIIILEDQPKIIIHYDEQVANVYRKQFDFMWTCGEAITE